MQVHCSHRISAPQTPRSARRLLGALLLCTWVSGCYHYVPIPPTDARPNEEVRVRVTESAATRLVKEFGGYTGYLDGQLSTAADSIAVSVAIARQYRGLALGDTRQTLFLGRSEVVEVRRRQLSRGRTALVAAATLAGFGVLISSVVNLGDPNPSDENTPPPPPSGLRALIRIPAR